MEGIDFCRKTYGIVVEGSLPIHIAYIFLLRSSRMFVFPQDKELALVVLVKCIVYNCGGTGGMQADHNISLVSFTLSFLRRCIGVWLHTTTHHHHQPPPINLASCCLI